MIAIINGIGRVGIRIAPPSGGGYTTRTQAFAAATGIADTTILNALNTFDLGLISNGIDTKMKALYPFVGGTASTHKFNFMDARDLNAAFRLQFNGGWVHSSTGALPNGTNAYANTYLNPMAQSITDASAHLSYYARTSATTSDPAEIANYTNTSEAFVLQSKSSSGANRYFYGLGQAATRQVTTAPTGLMMGSSVSSARRDLYFNGTSVANSTASFPVTLGNYPLYIGAGNIAGSSVTSYTNSQSALASIGNGLTDAEASTFYNLVQAFQTSLSRAV